MHADGLLCAGHGVTRSFSASRLDARLAASLKDEANVWEGLLWNRCPKKEYAHLP